MLLVIAFKNLRRNPRRTMTVLLTLVLGAGSLFLFHGFNNGIMNQYRENTIHARYGHGQINTQGYRNQIFEEPWQHWIANWETIKPQILAMPGVKQVFPRMEFFALLNNGRINISGRGQGIDGAEEAKFFYSLNIESGVTLAQQEDGILLGAGLAKALAVKPGGRVTVLANTVNGSLNGIDLTVVGIFHTGSKEFDDNIFRLQLKQAAILLDTDKIESVALGMNDDADWNLFNQALNKQFPALEATPFAVLDKIFYQNSVDWLNSQFMIIQIIILTIVILGIFNTISTSVLERKQEIGNLRANGESSGDILYLLSLEGLLLGGLGSLMGILFVFILNNTVLANGLLMPPAPGLTRQFSVFIELYPGQALQTFALSLFCSCLATLLAGYKVSKTPIGDLLRSA